MKANGTRFVIIAVFAELLFLLISFTVAAQPDYSFRNARLVSGTDRQEGAKYRFNNVRPATDAFVTITKIDKVTLSQLDGASGFDEAFQPYIRCPRKTRGYVEFRFDFVTAGTNLPKVMLEVPVTAIDIDGYIYPDEKVYEFDEFDNSLTNLILWDLVGTALKVNYKGNSTEALNKTAKDYPGIDTVQRDVMFTMVYTAVSSITIRAGVDNRSNFGFVDPTDGGESHRYSLAADWYEQIGEGRMHANAYAIDYRLDLFSNFTYALDTENGDQFEQFDERRVYGGQLSWARPLSLMGFEHELDVGVELRRDDIATVGLYQTVARQRIDTTREDEATQSSYSAYSSLKTRWSEHVRTEVGLRADRFEFDVRSNLAANSGSTNESIVSPKFSLILGPWRETEFFCNVGKGFHSNDARGTTIRVDPTDGVTPVDKVDPLVNALGADIGVRTAVLPSVQLTASLWTLQLDSELLFVGDAGITEASRASERRGIEAGAIWNPVSWLILDADLAWSRSRFTRFDPAGDRIPGAVEKVASVGLAVDHPSGWFGGARLRHFGTAPLIEDGSVESDPTTLMNLEAGYHLTDTIQLSAALFNVFDSRDSDITYFYESQLPGEAQPVSDIHFHPVGPPTFRLTLRATF
jgi:hypothetical protein